MVNHNADIALVTLRYQFKNASFDAAEEPFEVAGKKFNRGSFIIKNAPAADIEKAAGDLGLQIVATDRGAVGEDASAPRRRASRCSTPG